MDRRAVLRLTCLALAAAACGHPAPPGAPATTIATMLAVHDVGRSTAFYRDMLGFEVKFAKPGVTPAPRRIQLARRST
jgi:catechol-2,3-dioxygenase